MIRYHFHHHRGEWGMPHRQTPQQDVLSVDVLVSRRGFALVRVEIRFRLVYGGVGGIVLRGRESVDDMMGREDGALGGYKVLSRNLDNEACRLIMDVF
jgi:hypothetical protein